MPGCLPLPAMLLSAWQTRQDKAWSRALASAYLLANPFPGNGVFLIFMTFSVDHRGVRICAGIFASEPILRRDIRNEKKRQLQQQR